MCVFRVLRAFCAGLLCRNCAGVGPGQLLNDGPCARRPERSNSQPSGSPKFAQRERQLQPAKCKQMFGLHPAAFVPFCSGPKGNDRRKGGLPSGAVEHLAKNAREESGDHVLRYRNPEFSTVFSEKMSISAGPHRLYTEGCPEVCTKQPWASSSDQFTNQEQQNSKGDK